MNFLAHAVLSFNNPEILMGNLISDFVKGKKQYEFENAVQKGITLHRQIDEFTDKHPVTKKAAAVFKPFIGMYGGAFADVAYDHFLAKDQNEFTESSLLLFTGHTYSILLAHKEILPEKFSKMLPYMIEQNWLFNYREISGIEKSFAGIARRAKFLDNSTAAFNCFIDNYELFKECYQLFFPELKIQAKNYFQLLIQP